MVRLARHLQRFRRDERGTVLVELAIVGPLMLIISAGVFEFGNLIHDKLLIEAGLSDGARFAARCNSKLYTDAGLTIDCAGIATNIAVFGNVAGSGNPRVRDWRKTDVTISIPDPTSATATPCQDAISGGTVMYLSTSARVCVVTASSDYPYTSRDSVGLLSLLNITSLTLSATHQERLIRF